MTFSTELHAELVGLGARSCAITALCCVEHVAPLFRQAACIQTQQEVDAIIEQLWRDVEGNTSWEVNTLLNKIHELPERRIDDSKSLAFNSTSALWVLDRAVHCFCADGGSDAVASTSEAAIELAQDLDFILFSDLKPQMVQAGDTLETGPFERLFQVSQLAAISACRDSLRLKDGRVATIRDTAEKIGDVVARAIPRYLSVRQKGLSG